MSAAGLPLAEGAGTSDSGSFVSYVENSACPYGGFAGSSRGCGKMGNSGRREGFLESHIYL